MAIKKIKLPGMAQPVDIGTTWANVSDKPDLVTSEEAAVYMQKGVDYVTAGKKLGTTLGNKATAEGNNTTASGTYSHAEGSGTTASGNSSHAEGSSTTASVSDSHAEGSVTTASGQASHAEGMMTTSSGQVSHAEGMMTTSSGQASHAEGQGTTANHKSQHVFGEFNITDNSTATVNNRGNYVEIVGNGTNSNTRSNARTLDWNGNEVLAGKLTVGAAPTQNMDVATKQYVDNILATNDAMIFKGTIGTNGTITTLPATHEAGWTYKVITAGSFAGQVCEVGDMIICITDGVTATNDDWIVVQTNVDGAVIGPTSSTADHIATFTGTTGKAIQDSGKTITTSISSSSDDTSIPTSKAVVDAFANAKVQGANLTTTAGSIAYYSDTNGTFASDENFTWDSTNQTLTANKLKGYVVAGQKTGTTLGTRATAEGYSTTASGGNSHAEGSISNASGNSSHAEGLNTTASGNGSHTEGSQTIASGSYSHAEGNNTTASVTASHAEGNNTTASGTYSHAEGYYTTANHKSQHVFGEYNIADNSTATAANRGNYVEIVGNGTSTTHSNARTLDWGGNEVLAGKLTVGTAPTGNMDVATKQYVDNSYTIAGKKVGTTLGTMATAEGYMTMASGDYSHAEGRETTASGLASHAEGKSTTASRYYSHAEGSGTISSGNNSHAEGSGTISSGNSSHAEGSGTTSSGSDSHAEGNNTIASGNCSHAEGMSTGTYPILGEPTLSKVEGQIPYQYQLNTGTIPDDVNGISVNNQLYIITEVDSTSTIITLNRALPAEGSLTVTGYVINPVVSSGESSHAEGIGTIASGNYSHAEGNETKAIEEGSHAEGKYSQAGYYEKILSQVSASQPGEEGTQYALIPVDNENDYYPFNKGNCNIEYNNQQYYATYTKYQDETVDCIIVTISDENLNIPVNDQVYVIISGESSHAEGYGTQAFGSYSHAEGLHAFAYGDESHAEGFMTQASGPSSHAEGNRTTASGDYSHAEGARTAASGETSHAEGWTTTASGNYSHAEGQSTTASGQSSHAEGYKTNASGSYSHTEGSNTTASGDASHTEGHNTITSGDYSHAEGSGTTASGSNSHAEGYQTIASGDASHAEGSGTTASGNCSHAEGAASILVSIGFGFRFSKVEGQIPYQYQLNKSVNSEASGISVNDRYYIITARNLTEKIITLDRALPEGETIRTAYWVIAPVISSGQASHAEGIGTIANHKSQHVFGEHNIADDSTATADNRGNYVEIVGNGIRTGGSTTRSNARTLDWSGNEVLAGKLTVGANPTEDMDVVTKQYVDNITTIPNAGSISNTGVISIKHDSTELFTIQLPLYTGGVSNGT